MRRKLTIFVVVLLVVLLPFACRPHTVGAARTDSQFLRKATTTAKAALSSVETVALAVDNNETFMPYVSMLISNQEDSLSGISGTFGSIQPPTKQSDELREELSELLSRSLDDVSAVRIAVRRGDREAFRAGVEPLRHDAADLESFVEAHK